jgi:Fic family protein
MNNIFKLYEPSFASKLTDLIIELDHLRKKQPGGTTHPIVFFQLKEIFHMLESLGSARIEGNRTTLAEYIETKLEVTPSSSQRIKEIDNMLQTIRLIDDYIIDSPINNTFICQIHQKVVEGLLPPPEGEGDYTPGAYRKKPVTIQKSKHVPPDFTQVNDYMDGLVEFINSDVPAKYDLIKIAQAHHQFVWIHPFTNGNGRTVRMLTYAMLVKYNFKINEGRILNPTAIFCIDRDKYNEFLSKADSGIEKGIEQWCEYVLEGLKNEISKIDSLYDYSFLKEKILKPAIKYSLERQLITKNEFLILNVAIEKQVIQASDINSIFAGKASSEVSRQIRKLVEKKKMLQPISDNARKYIMRFDNNFLLRGVIKSLGDNGFIALKD